MVYPSESARRAALGVGELYLLVQHTSVSVGVALQIKELLSVQIYQAEYLLAYLLLRAFVKRGIQVALLSEKSGVFFCHIVIFLKKIISRDILRRYRWQHSA